MKIFKLLFLLSLTSLISYGQSSVPKPVKISSINFSMGIMADIYQRMDLESMRDISTNPEIFSHNLDGYQEDLWRESGGMMIKLDATFSLYNPISQSYSQNRELRMGIAYSEREPLIGYNKSSVSSDGLTTSRESLIYCNMQNELSVSGAYLWKTGGDKKRIFRAYAGLGSNLGLTFNDRMVVMWNSYEDIEDPATGEGQFESTELEFTNIKAKSVIFLRAFAPVGVELNVWRIKLGVEGSIGTGVHQTLGGRTYFMPYTFNFLLRGGFSF